MVLFLFQHVLNVCFSEISIKFLEVFYDFKGCYFLVCMPILINLSFNIFFMYFGATLLLYPQKKPIQMHSFQHKFSPAINLIKMTV